MDIKMKEDKELDVDITKGLSAEQVRKRIDNGLDNRKISPKFKTLPQIFISNLFTFFNIINFILAVCIFLVGSYKNLFFIGVVVCNIFIGIIQEIKARRVVRKLSILSQPEARVVRDGKEMRIPISEIVVDDIIIYNTGNQISADTIVKNGTVEVNEALITGESDSVLRKEGDLLISGSFIVSGRCYGQVKNVGAENYSTKIMLDVGKLKKARSEIMKYINTVVKIVGILIVPVGLMRFYKEYWILGCTLQKSVVSTVASLIGMIPEGIVLLTSIALMVGIIRLSKLRTLTQNLFSLETLARVDVLCLDKTGTITEGSMQVDDVILISDNLDFNKLENIVHVMCKNLDDKNSTIMALRDRFKTNSDVKLDKWKLETKIPFSSQRKWSGVSFAGKGSYLMGAPEILLGSNYTRYSESLKKFYDEGKRVILIANSDQNISIDQKNDKVDPLAFVVISDKIRENAVDTIEFFKQQGVNIKIISGDNPIAVSNIAKRVGIAVSDKYVDATKLDTDEDIVRAVREYNIFGRSTPYQKRRLIKAYQEAGHTVGMIGDGVNDILALKDSDCSIAMAQGSDAARQVAQFVLLDSNFASVPNIVKEGRRVVNNIERASSIFLIKNIYSFVLSLLLLFFATSYPFQPIQLTLLGVITIGIPSFFVAIEPNKDPIKGNFMTNVLSNAVPPAMAIIINILIINLVDRFLFNFSNAEVSTMAVILTGLCNLMALVKISKSTNLIHKIFIGLCLLGLIMSIIFFGEFFYLTNITAYMVTLIAILVVASYVVINSIGNFLYSYLSKHLVI